MPKRGNQEGSIIKRNDGRWMGRVSLPDGSRKHFYGKTRADVARKVARAVRDIDHGLPIINERVTTGEFLNRWLTESAKLRVRPSTYVSYTGHVRLYMLPVFGRVPLAKLGPEHVQRMMNKMLAKGLSPHTVRKARATLRCALGQAVQWGIIHRNVATLVDPPKAEQKEIVPPTPEQARDLLDAFRGHRTRQRRQRLRAGGRWQDTGFVFTSTVGTPLDCDNVTHRYQKLS